ncbi:hypothetical protein DLAC_11802 [Tieghemostelium lacteum]|uniref:Mannosyltransferase n=1 Tax=Tieghemostelium lacteum TaxID=361077 RepID=A0A151Z5Y2_TIELA|nr:hypothetical protein DLAC_11802 [Tieghemostelium lacteum]|eukprot:KYQ89366.1 hypothetical protein DLAC_11802 [Tieghemostelium lacteum]
MKQTRKSTSRNVKSNQSGNSKYSIISDIFSLIVIIVQIYVCPFTKVEESFNLQAIHDILYFRDDLSKYDHFEFPGVVPRTFLGPLLISTASSPIVKGMEWVLPNLFSVVPSKMLSLYIVRLVIGITGWLCFREFRKAVSEHFSISTGIWLNIVSCCQFHLFFYISRPLPNIFALDLILLAYANWIRGNQQRMIGFLTVAIFVFRSEILLLAGPIVLVQLLCRYISFSRFVLVGMCVAIFSILSSVVVDSYFWGRPIYPEAEVLHYNTVQNKSSNWGTSPWYWYFLIALPKSLIFLTVVLFYGLVVDIRRLWRFILPVIAFISVYSLLPHKEFRFIIYSVPLINMAIAVGFSHFYSKYSNKVIKCIPIAIVLANLVLSNYYLYISSMNYFGGYSMLRIHQLRQQTTHDGLLLNSSYVNHRPPPFDKMRIHIDNLAAISGVSRFLEINHLNIYDKLEYNVSYKDYTHLITPQIQPYNYMGFELLDRIRGLESIKFTRSNQFPFLNVKVIKKDLLFIFENKLL